MLPSVGLLSGRPEVLQAIGRPVEIGLADDQMGVLRSPGLQGGCAGSIAHQIELTEGGEIGAIAGVICLGGGNIVLLLLHISPHIGGLIRQQDEQTLASLIRHLLPAAVHQELVRVHPVGHGDKVVIGADHRCVGDVVAHLTAGKLTGEGCLEVPGQRQLVALAVIVGRGLDLRQVPGLEALHRRGQGRCPGPAVPNQLEAESPGQVDQGHIAYAAGQIGGGVHGHAAGLLLPIPEGQAGLPLYKGDLTLLLLVGQPQLGADGHRHLGPAVPVHIGRSGQLQGPSVQSDGHRALCLDRQAQRQHHGQRQRQR